MVQQIEARQMPRINSREILHDMGIFLQRNWYWVLPLVVGYAGRVIANQTLYPEYGLALNILSPLPGDLGGLDMEPVAGKILWNTIMGYSQLAFGTGFIGGAAKGAREILGMKAVIEGTAKNPYRKMALMIDTTNEVQEGSHHGDFFQEFYYQLATHPDQRIDFEKRYGPTCEIVPQNAPTPTKKPKTRYFRTPNPSNTDFLREINAQRTTATISVLMSRSHTVWDKDRKPLPIKPDTIVNFNNTISTTLSAGEIPRFVIVNKDLKLSYGVFEESSGKSIQIEEDALAYFKERGYQTIVAEDTIMSSLVDRFTQKKYQRILLVNDATESGQRIASQWYEDYKNADNVDKPEVIQLSAENYREVIRSGNFDAIFLIGAEDTEVARVAEDILNDQKAERFKNVPLEVLMEGRGSADKLAEIEDNDGHIHFVHNILAKRCVELLLPEKRLPWLPQHERVNN